MNNIGQLVVNFGIVIAIFVPLLAGFAEWQVLKRNSGDFKLRWRIGFWNGVSGTILFTVLAVVSISFSQVSAGLGCVGFAGLAILFSIYAKMKMAQVEQFLERIR